MVDLEGRADPKAFQTALDAVLADDANTSLDFVNPWLFVALREHDSGGVQRALSNMGDDGCFDETIPFPNGWCEGLAAWVRGDASAARAALKTRETNSEDGTQPTRLCGCALRTRCGRCRARE